MNLLPTNLGCLANVTATQSSKFAMTGVYVSVKEDGYTVAATDSKSLAVVTGKAPADVKDYPAMPEIEYAPNSQSAAIVPAKSWSKHFASAKKLTAKCHKELLRTVPIVIGERVTTMGATNLDQQAVETSNNVEG